MEEKSEQGQIGDNGISTYSMEDIFKGVTEVPVNSVLPFLATTIEERILKSIGCDDLIGRSMFVHEQLRSRTRIFESLKESDLLPLQVTVDMTQIPSYQCLRLYETKQGEKNLRLYHFVHDFENVETIDLIKLNSFCQREIAIHNEMTFANLLALIVKCRQEGFNNFIIPNKEKRKIYFCSFFKVKGEYTLSIFRIVDIPPEANLESPHYSSWISSYVPYFTLEVKPTVKYILTEEDYESIRRDPLVEQELNQEKYKSDN